MKTQKTLIIIILTFVAGLTFAEKQLVPGVGLTIYNDNFAVIRDSRELGFNAGINTMKFTNVASAIDPTSMKFECLSSPGDISILEQNYEYDLVNKESLLKRYIDREITLYLKGSGSEPGRIANGVLSAYIGGSIMLKSGDKMDIISAGSIDSISLEKAPEDLVTKPTLVWMATAKETSKQLCQVTYTTSAINWKVDYTAVLGPNDDKIDLSGWVTIDNKSGASYKNATIKLMAGDVRRVTEPTYRENRKYMIRSAMVMEDSSAGFAEKAFAEYHLYTLGRKSTINNNQVKQIELITPAAGVPAEKRFIYDRMKDQKKIQVKIEFENKEEFGLGIALPKGKIRVFKKDDADGQLEFVGEDLIDHTARKEKLSLYIGNAFDIVPEHKMLDSKIFPFRAGMNSRTEKHQVELRNRKDEAITVYVDEHFSNWVNWKITEANFEYEKKDSNTTRFKVDVPADSTATLKFSTYQKW